MINPGNEVTGRKIPVSSLAWAVSATLTAESGPFPEPPAWRTSAPSGCVATAEASGGDDRGLIGLPGAVLGVEVLKRGRREYRQKL